MGLGRELYGAFFKEARRRGRRTVRAITSHEHGLRDTGRGWRVACRAIPFYDGHGRAKIVFIREND